MMILGKDFTPNSLNHRKIVVRGQQFLAVVALVPAVIKSYVTFHFLSLSFLCLTGRGFAYISWLGGALR
jgi:hypothetical protein